MNTPTRQIEARAHELAEESLLGAILISPEIITEVAKTIRPSDFRGGESSRNARIYKAMTECEHPDQISVARKLQELKLLVLHDCAYLRHLVSVCPMSLDYPYYVEAVLKYAVDRNSRYYLDKGEYDKAQDTLSRIKKTVYKDGI